MSELGSFQTGKLWIEQLLGLEKDTLHVLVGLVVFVLIIAIFRRKPWHILPVFGAVLAAFVGEALDLYEMIELREIPWENIPWEHLTHDLWVTSAVPMGLFLLAFAFRPMPKKDVLVDDDSSDELVFEI